MARINWKHQQHNILNLNRSTIHWKAKKQTNHIGPIITHIITTLSKANDITDIVNSTNQLAIATIASGRKGKFNLIHNLDHQGPKLVALFVTRNKATSQQVEPTKLVGARTKESTELEDILKERLGKRIPKKTKEKMDHLANSDFLPQELMKYLINKDLDYTTENLLNWQFHRC